jgi:hypothetical protein
MGHGGRKAAVHALLLLFSASGCAGGNASLDVRRRFERPGADPVEVRGLIQPEHAGSRERYLHAAVMSLSVLTPILGTFPQGTIVLIDPPWGHGTFAADNAVVLERTPWWSSPASMVPELAAARAITRRHLHAALDTTALPVWFVDGLVEYWARRIVAPIFQGPYLGTGYAMLEPRYFGGFVPRFLRIRLLPESDGEPLVAYRVRPRVDATSALSQADRRSLTAKTMLTLNTLERWLSAPVLDGAVAEFAGTFRGNRPALSDFMRTLSASSGQDLSWLLVQAFGSTAVFDYAVTELTSTPSGGGEFETTVVVGRLGDGLFTGSAAPRVGPYESGRGVAIAIELSNGERIIDRWDGRDGKRTFVYRSRAAAVSATVDPEHTIVLDVHRTNNSRTQSGRSGIAATRWAGRWMLWLQQALLTYAFFV